MFRNVRIVVPPKAGWTPYRDYIGSRLEILDGGHRRAPVVHTVAEFAAGPQLDDRRQGAHLQQPGRLYRFRPGHARGHRDQHRHCDAQQQRPRAFVRREDARHQPSQRGRRRPVGHLHDAVDRRHAEAHHAQRAIVLHGWSPDSKWLVYTGQRDKALDIYKISAGGGNEVRLTTPRRQRRVRIHARRPVDLLQLHAGRADADLADEARRQRPEQVTKTSTTIGSPTYRPTADIVVISSRPDIKPANHPFYKHVYLRHLMPIGGGEPRVIAYLYESSRQSTYQYWSPDSKRLAFVSNSALPAPH